MKKNLFTNYIEYISFIELMSKGFLMDTKYIQDIQDIKDICKIQNSRILHYKSDILLSLIERIEKKEEISFDSFTAFFDFQFIESTLINFPLNERFQIFEIILKSYIKSLQDINELNFYNAYSIKNLKDVLANNIPKINEDDKWKSVYQKRKEQLAILKTTFSKDGFNFNEVKRILIYLGVNEHFAHFFLEYIQEKYQNKKKNNSKTIAYYFEDNPEYVYKIAPNFRIQIYLLENYFNSIKLDKQEESKQIHYSILKLLEGNYGETFLGYYDAIYYELKYIGENENDIFKLLLKAILSDFIFLKDEDNLPNEFQRFQKLEFVLKKNFNFKDNKNINKEEIKEALLDLHFPKEFVDIFLEKLINIYSSIFQKPKDTPVYKKDINIPQKETTTESINPFLKIDLMEQKITETLLSMLNDEELEKYNKVLKYTSLNNSSIEGYQKQLKNCLAEAKEIAKCVMESPEEKELYITLLKETFKQIDEIIFLIDMVIPYKRVKEN